MTGDPRAPGMGGWMHMGFTPRGRGAHLGSPDSEMGYAALVPVGTPHAVAGTDTGSSPHRE